MKLFFSFCAVLAACLFSNTWYAQGALISESPGSPDATAILELQSVNRGFLPPRMTESERDNISSPAEGLVILNTTTGCLNMFIQSAWKQSCFECAVGTIQVSATSPVCEGESFELDATVVSGAVYAWSGPDGFTSSEANPQIPDAQLTDAGMYSVTVSKAGCSASPVSVEVVINPRPDAPIASSNTPVDNGNDLLLFASQVDDAIYEWTGPDGFSSADQNPVITSASPANAGVYSVIAVSGEGCESEVSTTEVEVTNREIFEYTGADQTFIVPDGVTSVNVKLWGAAGAGSTQAGSGGGGGYAAATMAVTPGESLTIIVGQGGVKSGTSPTYGGGGSGDGTRGSGGGRSAIRRSGVELITAGGGGAAGGGDGNNRDGGAGGGANGENGFGPNAGGGGSQLSGGAAGSCNGTNAGSQYTGANGLAGGGAGYYGGGSGGDCSCCAGSAGGGSGYVGGAGLTNTSNIAGSGTTPGNASDADRNGAGQGSTANGTPGRIIIGW